VLREACPTAKPRVRNEGVRGSSPLSSTDITAGQRPSPDPVCSPGVKKAPACKPVNY